jgi:cell division ATPase FtsA
MLTNMIEKSFNISFEEAEKMKQEYGLQRNLENKETLNFDKENVQSPFCTTI